MLAFVCPSLPTFRVGLLSFALLGVSLLLPLAGCDDGADTAVAGSAATEGSADGGTSADAEAGSENRVQLTIDGREIRAGDTSMGITTAVNSMSIHAGWVNADAARAAGASGNEADARASFGLLSMRVALSAFEPGTYPLTSEPVYGIEGEDQRANIVVNENEDLNIPATLTSAQGTLNVETLEMSDDGRQVEAIQATFDGTFTDPEGGEVPVTGEIHWEKEQ